MDKVLRNYARGICGGLLFSLPMIYTMEIWWAGIQLHPPRQLFYFLACALLLLAFNRLVGLRCDRSMLGVAFDSIEALGLGILVSFTLLALLDRFQTGDTPASILGKTVLEAGLVSIGICVGKAQFGASPEEEGMEGEGAEAADTWHGQGIYAICGAVIVTASVGPTDEIQHLSDIATWRIFLLALGSLMLGILVLHFSDFINAKPAQGGVLGIMAGGFQSYFLALAVCTGILYVFGRFDGLDLAPAVNQVVVLGFPGSLGASAGRLLLQNA